MKMNPPTYDAAPQANVPPPTGCGKILFGLMAVAIGIVLVPAVLIVGMGLMMQSSRDLPADDVAEHVAGTLVGMGAIGAGADERGGRVAAGVTGVNGYTESSGIHGDGTDWYEAELTPALMAELRAGLAMSTDLNPSDDLPGDDSAPSWWPDDWPAGTRCYGDFPEYLIVPPEGTRVWLMRHRT